jgi:hypothetical protein
MVDRFEVLRSGVGKSQKIIEVGPAHNAVFPKRDGWHAYSIDHTDQAGLRTKYRTDLSVDPSLIEPVDFVCADGDLSAAVPVEHHGTFDVFVASHVIEHTPDLVAFFSTAEALTKPEGRVILAIPDKRVCFDYYRPISTVGEVLEAFHQHRTSHSRKTLWDFIFHCALKRKQLGWARNSQDMPELAFKLADASASAAKSDSGEYVDAHNWIFIPASFELIVTCLAKLGLTDWQIAQREIAETTEFYVSMGRGGKAAISRMSEEEFSSLQHRLLEAVMLELDDQSRQMPMSIGASAERRLQAVEADRQCQVVEAPELQRQALEAEARVERLQADLDAAKTLIAAMRATRTWKMRDRVLSLIGAI